MIIQERTIIDLDFNPDRYLVCPITGSKLIFQNPKKENDNGFGTPRDCGYKWISESNPNIGYRASPFDTNKLHLDTELPIDNIPSLYGNNISREEHKKLYEEAKKISDSLKAYGKYDRVFVLNPDETWTEYIFVCYKYLPHNSTLEEIEEVIAEDKRSYEEKKALYLQDPEKYGPFVFRVTSQTISNELVDVKPLSAPSGMLYYMDLKNG